MKFVELTACLWDKDGVINFWQWLNSVNHCFFLGFWNVGRTQAYVRNLYWFRLNILGG